MGEWRAVRGGRERGRVKERGVCVREGEKEREWRGKRKGSKRMRGKVRTRVRASE